MAAQGKGAAAARRIVLLTGEREVPFFRDFLLARNPALDVVPAFDLAGLRAAVAADPAHTRVIAFVTFVIVPADILAALGPVPYNIHPGPPDYPGSHPESFALYEGATQFGATGHAMTARVDAGAIVASSRFAIVPQMERVALADAAYRRAVDVFATIAGHCAMSDAPLKPNGEAWSGRKRTRAQFRALCDRAATAPAGERTRLKRALGPDYRPAAA